MAGWPSSNNAIEAMNSTINRDFTLRDRLPAGQKSGPRRTIGRRRIRKLLKIRLQPSLSPARSCHPSQKMTSKSTMPPSANSEPLMSLKAHRLYTWNITIDFKDVGLSACTCPYFQKRRNCTHVLGMHIHLNLTDVPRLLSLFRLVRKENAVGLLFQISITRPMNDFLNDF